MLSFSKNNSAINLGGDRKAQSQPKGYNMNIIVTTFANLPNGDVYTRQLGLVLTEAGGYKAGLYYNTNGSNWALHSSTDIIELNAAIDAILLDIASIESNIDNIELDIIDLQDNKVDKDGTKVLSDNNYDDIDKAKVDNTPSNVTQDLADINQDILAITQAVIDTNDAIPTTLAELSDDSTHRLVTDSEKSTWSGKADLVGGTVPASQLPSYVDDVIEFANLISLPLVGESGKIYVTLDDNKTYRWSGTQYVFISGSLALGETVDSAYRGDRGKTAYDHSQTTGNPHDTTKSNVGLSNVDNTSDLDKPISTLVQSELYKKINRTNENLPVFSVGSILYNYYSAIAAIAPSGWRVPSQADFETLITYTFGETLSGGELKQTGTTYWETPNTGAVNSVGFNATGNGYRSFIDGEFYESLRFTNYWTTTPYDSTSAIAITLSYDNASAIINQLDKLTGGTIRLMRDDNPGVSSITDLDGNIYNVITIGDQYWLDADWKCLKLANEDNIPIVSDANDWISLNTLALSYYDNLIDTYNIVIETTTGNLVKINPIALPTPSVTQELLNGKEPANANIQSHVTATGNPHGTTIADISTLATRLNDIEALALFGIIS